jgi:nucleoside-diphosphate-sugar epimerase
MPSADRAVVVGGAGFIGSHLTSQLGAAGCSVTVVSRSAGSAGRDTPGVSYVSGAVADADAMMRVIEGASVVYDLSMGGGSTWADYERDFIGGARNVARACQRHGVRRLLYASSISALFLGRHAKLDDSVGADTKAEGRSFYSRGKVEAEKALLALHRDEKLPVVILRPAIVLGPGGFLAHGALGVSVSDTCILGWGSGRNPLPCVLARDVAGAMVLAKDAPGIEGLSFNLSGDIRPTAQEFVSMLRERTHRDFRFYPRSLWAMGAFEYLIWMTKALVRKADNTRTSFRDLQSLTMAADLDCSAAKKLLGWRPESDRDVFFREAIDSHLKPFHPGDLRLVPSGQNAL